MANPKISFILPTKGRPEGLRRAVKSIQNQNCPEPFEIIILHDGELPLSDWSEYDNIRVLFSSERQGVPKIFKRGIEKSTGEWIVFASNDVEFDPQCITRAFLYVRDYPSCKFVAFNTGELLPDNGNVCEHFMIHRDLIPKLGGEVFDTEFNHVGVDNLLWAKLGKLGQCGYCERAIVKHHHFSKPGGLMDEVYELGWNEASVASDRALLKRKLAELEAAPAPVKTVRKSGPRIAVYSIAKNEEKFLERWVATCAGADEMVLLDTGSTDGTVAKARALGVTVHEIKLETWRFDVARTTALAAVPMNVDWCISLDLDELMPSDWREKLEKAIGRHPYATRFKYHFCWNAHQKNQPKIEFFSEKIHRRHGYYWRNPVHEILASAPLYKEDMQTIEDFLVEHHPDDSKSRGSYLPLLEMSTTEDPQNDRNSHYLGREYIYNRMWQKGITELTRHLSLKSATWNEERAASARFIAQGYIGLNDLDKAREWYKKGTQLDPTSRDTWYDLAFFEYGQKQWQPCIDALLKMFQIKDRKLTYISTGNGWGPMPYDIGSLAAYEVGQLDLAKEWFKVCFAASPTDPRMISNAAFLT